MQMCCAKQVSPGSSGNKLAVKYSLRMRATLNRITQLLVAAAEVAFTTLKMDSGYGHKCVTGCGLESGMLRGAQKMAEARASRDVDSLRRIA